MSRGCWVVTVLALARSSAKARSSCCGLVLSARVVVVAPAAAPPRAPLGPAPILHPPPCQHTSGPSRAHPRTVALGVPTSFLLRMMFPSHQQLRFALFHDPVVEPLYLKALAVVATTFSSGSSSGPANLRSFLQWTSWSSESPNSRTVYEVGPLLPTISYGPCQWSLTLCVRVGFA